MKRVAPQLRAGTYERTTMFLSLLGAGVALLACSSKTTNLARSQAGSSMDAATAPDSARPNNEAGSDATTLLPVYDAGLTLCGDHRCACSNGMDDEGDRAVDGFDPECTGSFDDDEASFATGVHGESKEPRCRDCFFDANSGSGDDGCRVAPSCTVDGTPSDGTGNCATCAATTECSDACLPRTPNGCDCFGCCEVWSAGAQVAIRLSDSCSVADLADTTKCPRCIVDTTCKNECGRCELCPGRTEADLPADCGTYSCDGAERCGPTLPCSNQGYCQLGCCIPPLI